MKTREELHSIPIGRHAFLKLCVLDAALWAYFLWVIWCWVASQSSCNVKSRCRFQLRGGKALFAHIQPALPFFLWPFDLLQMCCYWSHIGSQTCALATTTSFHSPEARMMTSACVLLMEDHTGGREVESAGTTEDSRLRKSCFVELNSKKWWRNKSQTCIPEFPFCQNNLRQSDIFSSFSPRQTFKSRAVSGWDQHFSAVADCWAVAGREGSVLTSFCHADTDFTAFGVGGVKKHH